MNVLISYIYKGGDCGGGFLPPSDCNTGLQLDAGLQDIALLHTAVFHSQGAILVRKHAEIHGACPRRVAGSAMPKQHQHN